MSARNHPRPHGSGPPSDELAREYARIGAADENELAGDLLAQIPVHEGRDPLLLRSWAATALEFGRSMARGRGTHASAVDIEVTDEPGGGVRADEVLLAEFLHKPSGDRIIVHNDAVEFAHRIAQQAGWGKDFGRGTVREAALSHETCHRILHAGQGRVLRKGLGHTALRLGPLRIPGHVVGADEIAAHAFAQERCSLRRSPLALNAAIAAHLAHGGPYRSGTAPGDPGDHP